MNNFYTTYHGREKKRIASQLSALINGAVRKCELLTIQLNHDGATSLMSAEYRLIDTNILDAVSNELSEEFGQLLNLAA